MIRFEAQTTLQSATGSLRLDLSFSLKKGGFMAIYGKSGAGKTTLLRLLAGLQQADNCSISFDDEVWNDSTQQVFLSPQAREVGLVFQDYALFPHMTVLEQLEFALPKGANKTLLSELLELMELSELRSKRPESLSGGQKQRVALARAIARKPKLLLLDEPLSALDEGMRLKLQDYLFKAHRHFGLTTMLVSHSIPEIFRLADSVIVLENGQLIQQGDPFRVFSGGRLSSKFKLSGEIVEIRKSDVVYVLSVLSNGELLKVIATEQEVRELSVGQTVLLASKAFNPLIQKIG